MSANGDNVIGWIGETTIAGNNIGIQRTAPDAKSAFMAADN